MKKQIVIILSYLRYLIVPTAFETFVAALMVLTITGSLLLSQNRINLAPSMVQVSTVGGATSDTINGLKLMSMVTDFEFNTVTLSFQPGEISAGVFTPSPQQSRQVVVVQDDGAVMSVQSPWVQGEIILGAGKRAAVLADIQATRNRYLNGAVAVGAIIGTVE